MRKESVQKSLLTQMVAAATDRAGIASVPQARVSGDALPGIWIGGQIVRLGPLDRHHRSAQGAREHFVDMGHGAALKPQQQIFGYFGQVRTEKRRVGKEGVRTV